MLPKQRSYHTMVTSWENKEVAWSKSHSKSHEQCQVHADEEDHGQHQYVNRTTRWRVSQNDRGHGESTSMVWPILGSRTAKEQNRTEQSKTYNMYIFGVARNGSRGPRTPNPGINFPLGLPFSSSGLPSRIARIVSSELFGFCFTTNLAHLKLRPYGAIQICLLKQVWYWASPVY